MYSKVRHLSENIESYPQQVITLQDTEGISSWYAIWASWKVLLGVSTETSRLLLRN